MFKSMNFQPLGYSLSASVIPDEWSLSCRELVCLWLCFMALSVLELKWDRFLYCKGKIVIAASEE